MDFGRRKPLAGQLVYVLMGAPSMQLLNAGQPLELRTVFTLASRTIDPGLELNRAR